MFIETRVDNPIGLDISDLSVKLVQFRDTPNGLSLSAYTDIYLPSGLINQDVIQNKAGLTDFLKQTFSDKKRHKGTLKGRSVVASVPESKAFVRVVTFPQLEAEELSSAVPLQAEQYIPLPVDQMQIDWQVVGQSDKGLQVLITATPKSFVQDLVEVMRNAGLVPQALEVESAAIARCLIDKPSQQIASLIVDMDAYRSSLIVYANNSIQFTSSMPIGGDAIDDAISQRVGVSRQEAENLKRMHGIPLHSSESKTLAPDVAKLMSEISLAIDPVLNNLFDDMRDTVKFYEEHGGGEGEIAATQKVTRVILCGGTAKLLNLTEHLQAKLKADPYFTNREIKVTLGDAWINVVKSGVPPFSKREALSYSTSIGLALRNYLS